MHGAKKRKILNYSFIFFSICVNLNALVIGFQILTSFCMKIHSEVHQENTEAIIIPSHSLAYLLFIIVGHAARSKA